MPTQMLFTDDMPKNEHLIASANTSNGFAIGIVKNSNYLTGKDQFQVVRLDRQSKYVTISRHADEADARKRANAEWKADKGIAPAMQMIYAA